MHWDIKRSGGRFKSLKADCTDFIFPDLLKTACAVPAFKKERSKKENYRPISILNTFSKVFERFVLDQLIPFFNETMSKFLSDCRKNVSCQNVLLRLMSQSIPTGYIPPVSSSKRLPGGRDLTFESCPGAGNSTRAGILWKLKVKRFVSLLVLLVINRGCPKNC